MNPEDYGFKEIQLGDHTIIIPINPCPYCGDEMQNIVMFGDVCFTCNKNDKIPNNQTP